MESTHEQDSGPRKTYRALLIGFLVIALGVTIWMSLPPKRVDLTFLKQLSPTKIHREQNGSMQVKGSAAEVKRLLRNELTADRGWRTLDETGETFQNRNGVVVWVRSTPITGTVVVPRPKSAGGHVRTKPVGPSLTSIDISDPRKLVIWP